MDRTTDSGSVGRGFESLQAYYKKEVIKMAHEKDKGQKSDKKEAKLSLKEKRKQKKQKKQENE